MLNTVREIRKAIRDNLNCRGGGVYLAYRNLSEDYFKPLTASRLMDAKTVKGQLKVQLLETGCWETIREGDKIEVR